MNTALDIIKLCSLFALISFLTITIAASPVNAHESTADGNISAELHIHPDNKPISGVQTDYSLEFYDEANLFTLPLCDCKVTVQQNDTIISSKQLNDEDLLVSEQSVTFPTTGAYVLNVTGNPKTPDAFQPFALTYPIEVTAPIVKTSATIVKDSPNILWPVLIVGSVSTGFILFVVLQIRRKNRSKQ